MRHCLAHSAGLPGFSRRFTVEEFLDWDTACADLAGQATWWEPGTQSAYHIVTQGWLIGEVVRRISGKSFGTYFKEEVAEKVGADFHIGVDPKHFSRIADVLEDPQPAALDEVNPFMDMDPESIYGKVVAQFPISRWRTMPRLLGGKRKSLPATGTATPGRWSERKLPWPTAAKLLGSSC